MSAIVGMSAFSAFVLGSLLYVYKWRGRERFKSFTEYVRKGWPIFTPLNCLLYIFTKAHGRGSILNPNHFPELSVLKDHWKDMQVEALELWEKGYFDQTKNPESAAHFDLGFRTFYKYGWGKFYINWYGSDYPSAQKLCPKTVALVEKIPGVHGAMFSVLPPGSKLTRHLDPVAISIRYHLGLSTPSHPKCYINVDGKTHTWRDGEDFMFDETYLHFAHNDTDQARLILMCDVQRPLLLGGWLVNSLYMLFMRQTTVPNLEGDPRGLVNRVFVSLGSTLQKTKKLKKSNPKLYKVLKHSLNLMLLLLLCLLVYGGFCLVSWLVGLV